MEKHKYLQTDTDLKRNAIKNTKAILNADLKSTSANSATRTEYKLVRQKQYLKQISTKRRSVNGLLGHLVTSGVLTAEQITADGKIKKNELESSAFFRDRKELLPILENHRFSEKSKLRKKAAILSTTTTPPQYKTRMREAPPIIPNVHFDRVRMEVKKKPVNKEKQEPVQLTVTFINRDDDMLKRAYDIADIAVIDKLNSKFGSIARLTEFSDRKKFAMRAVELMKQTGHIYLDPEITAEAIKHHDYLKRFQNSNDPHKIRAREEYDALNAKFTLIKKGVLIKGEKLYSADKARKNTFYKDIMEPLLLKKQPETQKEITDEHKLADQQIKKFLSENSGKLQFQPIIGNPAGHSYNLPSFLTSNFMNIVVNLREKIASKQITLDEIQQNLDLRFADLRWGAETNPPASTAIKPNQPGENSAKEKLSNPTTAGIISASILYAASKISEISSKAKNTLFYSAPVVGSLVGGAIAYNRRDKELQADSYSLHRSRVYSDRKAVTNNDKRFPSTDQEIRSVENLMSPIPPNDSRFTYHSSLIERIAQIDTRLEKSYIDGRDYISYSNRFSIEQDKLRLLRFREALMSSLRQDKLNIDQLTGRLRREKEYVAKEISKKTTEYNKKNERKKRANKLGIAAIAVVTGLATAPLTQQGIAGAARKLNYDEMSGPTLLEKAFKKEPGEKAASRIHQAKTVETKPYHILGNAKLPPVEGTPDFLRTIPIPVATSWKRGTDNKWQLIITQPGTLYGRAVAEVDQKRGKIIWENIDTAYVHIDKTEIQHPFSGKETYKSLAGSEKDIKWLPNENKTIDGNELSLHNEITPDGNGITFMIKPLENKSWYREGDTKYIYKDIREIKNNEGLISFWQKQKPQEQIIVVAPGGNLTLNRSDWEDSVTIIKKSKKIKVPNAYVANLVLGDLSRFNHSSELTDHREALNMNVSAGVGIESADGQISIRHIASIHGSGQIPDAFYKPATNYAVASAVRDTVSTPVYEQKQKNDNSDDSAPLIPIPFAPRFPLRRRAAV